MDQHPRSWGGKDLAKVITSKGYSIRKDALTEAEKLRVEKELTVAPIVQQKFAAKEDLSFKIYRESKERYYLPRRWGEAAFGPADSNIVSEGRELLAEAKRFVGTPYEYQKDIINMFIKADANGLICVPCGRGKTFMAVAIAAKLGKRFLVIVDKEFLMNQWKGEIQSLLPGLRIGICQAGRREIDPEKYDCTLCMIQTLCGQEFLPNTFQDYGFAIFDECHHLGASHFSKALMKVQTRKMLGLSATPKREDGLTKVFEWFLGEPVYWEKTRDPDPSVTVRPIFVTCKDAAYVEPPLDWRKEIVMARLLTQVVECQERTAMIAECLKQLCEDKRRKVLVLSERISHLNAIEDLLPGYSIGYYIGGMKEEVRETGAANAQILLASYAMASEAMNIKTLNSVIMASPRKNVEQSTGRILRIQADKRIVSPLIIDIVDVHGVYRSQYKKRCIYYRKCKYTIMEDDIEPDESVAFVQADANGCLFTDD
uniref:Helicase ATP-binding domain-containing protein n=1 Tax=viral metagenome TaxID=1070528 RepID=A0A6C0BCN3_9ZZZZ